MEYEVLDFPDVDYNFFFKELPRYFNAARVRSKKKRRTANRNSYASVMFDGIDDLVAGSGNSFDTSFLSPAPAGIPFDKYGEEGLHELIDSQKHAFFISGAGGGNDLHYLKFGGRTLQISNSNIQWRVDWKSESIPFWLRIAYGEAGTSELRSDLKARVIKQRSFSLLGGGQNGYETGFSPATDADRYQLVTQGDLDRQRNNPRIMEYSGDIDEEYTARKKQKVVDPKTGKSKTVRVEEVRRRKFRAYDDETPWCSIFIHWVMRKCGIQGPLRNPGLALSWEGWGKKMDGPVLGSIAVKKRKGGGHVAFVVGEKDGNVILLGGNQDDKVCFMKLSPSQQRQIVAYVYPLGYEVDPLFHYLSTVDGEKESYWAKNQNQA